MEPIIIEFAGFPEEIQLSAERRAKYFKKGDELPAKYTLKHPTAGIGLAKDYQWKAKNGIVCLWNIRAKDWVVKNSKSVGKPRYVSIAGNDIMRMYEHTRNTIVSELKKYFVGELNKGSSYGTGRLYDGNTIPLTHFPLNIRMEIHTFPHYMNWDLDNLWIYNKCFQDAMKETGIIPDDNIRYITWPAAPRFIPVTREADRKMRFEIRQETDARVTTHLLYHSAGHRYDSPLELDGMAYPFNFINISTDSPQGKPGDVYIENETMVGYTCWMNVGKRKDKLVDAEKALTRVRHQCYQLNCMPVFSREDYARMEELIRPIFMEKGIPVKVV